MRKLIFLQNAYSDRYHGRRWPRASWLRHLPKTTSGRNVGLLTDDLSEVVNTAPEVGCHPSSCLPPDRRHMLRAIARHRPDVIVACGLQAVNAVAAVWDGSVIELPHPACRWLPRDLYLMARQILDWPPEGVFRVRVWQGKGGPIEVLPAGHTKGHQKKNLPGGFTK